MEPKKNKFSFALLKRILSYSKPYKKLFFLAIVLTLTLASLAIVRPLLINQMLNCIGAVNPSDDGYLAPSEKISFIIKSESGNRTAAFRFFGLI